MKKILTLVALLAAVTFSSCKFDDGDLWNSVNGLEGRVAKLEELCKQMNTNISSLQTIVSALQNSDYVTGVTPIIQNGKEVGYTITFSKSNPVTIYHGKDGVTPTIGVKQDTDGIYYWTLNGEWLTDKQGHKIKSEGTDGISGTTPKFKIENDYWFISYDNGTSWTQLGKATSDDGTGGDSMFTDVDYKTNTDYVIFTLADGTQIKLPTWSAFEALRTLCNQTNTNLESLQAIVTALQNRDYITDVEPLTENGKIIGYTIKFAKSSPIVIYNGKDGSGTAPIIGVKKDSDGIYYWTLDGAFIIVEGQKIRAEGKNGVDGEDGISPKLEIRDGYWFISYDNGKNWTQLGKATGEDGKDANSIKIRQDENNVYFELADGTIITIPISNNTSNKYIQFADPLTKYICCTQKIYTGYTWDENCDGEISYQEAASIKYIDKSHKFANTDISSFNELNFFTGLATIGQEAFSGCSKLYTIIIPKNVQTIQQKAFSLCYLLQFITFGDNVTEIKNQAFYCCSSLRYIVLGNCVETIGEYAFFGANQASEMKITTDKVILPASIKSIGNYAFRNRNITDVYCKAIIPPSLGGSEVFGNYWTTSWQCKYYVPMSAVDAYKNAPYWKELGDNIIGYDFAE